MKKLIKIATMTFLLLSMLTACVTTESGSIRDKADKQKALKYSTELARSYIAQGNWDAAKRHLKTALEMDDSSAEVYEGLALVFQNTGEYDLAEENYKRAIDLSTEFSRLRNNYGAFLYQQRRYKEASEQFEIVVKDTLYAKRAGAYVNMGRCYIRLEEYIKAENAFQRAYLMSRGNNDALVFQLAEVNFLLENYPKSQQYYDAYRSRVERQPARALWLGIRLAEKFDNDNAQSSYALALKNLYPTSKEYLEYKSTFGHGG